MTNTPIVIRDFSVLAHHIFNQVDNAAQRLRVTAEDPLTDPRVQQWVKASWALMINRAPDSLMDQPIFNVIVLDRKSKAHSVPGMGKGYWRHTFLKKWWAINDPSAPPEKWCYKFGRKEKTSAFYSVSSIGSDYVASLGVPVLSAPGYEADDFAGALIQHRQMLRATKTKAILADTTVYLHTVDTDWLQLVGEDVWFCNTGPAAWGALVRGHAEALTWINKKILKRTIKAMGGVSHPQDIVKMKVLEGDKSDNLVPGSPREVIDLMNPPAEFNVRLRKEGKQMLRLCAAPKDNRNRAHFRLALGYLQTNNLPFVALPSLEPR